MGKYNLFSLNFINVIILLNSVFIFGQNEVDTLYNKNFDELFEIYNSEPNFKKSEIYINVWLKKAKDNKNVAQLITGFEIASLLYKDDRSLKYLDSILSISLKNKKYNNSSLAAYRMKGKYFHRKRDFKRELKNYMLAKNYKDDEEEPILGCLLEYNIGLVKNRIQEHHEALTIHKNNFPLMKKHLRGKLNYSYIHSIYAIANSYNYIKQLDSAAYYNKLGIEEATLLNDKDNINYFTLNQGITHYYLKQYNKSIDSLIKASEYFKLKKDLPNTSESYYFLGKSYQQLGEFNLTKKYFKKVDTIFRKTNDLLPILKGTYNFLIDNAQKNNNLKQQIDYTNQLIKLDSILYTNEIYINKNIIKEYDIPKLISNKEKLIKKLKNKEKNAMLLFIVLIIIILIVTIIAINQNRKRKTYKIRFEKILHATNVTPATATNTDTDNTKINIPKETIDAILEKLKLFESKQKFISKNITLNSLAKDFNTNTNYLSKIINHFKGMSFSNYLRNLRIEYIINKLRTESILRKFTIKAIAQEAGFNNSESFSKAFYNTKGIKPSYFLKELEKIHESN